MIFRTATFRQPPAALNAAKPGRGEFCILHSLPTGPIEARWRACLGNCDFPTHYAAPEFFLEPMLRQRRGFAILSMIGEEVTGVLTGINGGDHVQSGLSVRPQIAFSRSADRGIAMASLVAGLVSKAKGAKLVDLFVWSDMESVVPPRFRRRQCEGVAMLDLSRSPDALFRSSPKTSAPISEKQSYAGFQSSPRRPAMRSQPITQFMSIGRAARVCRSHRRRSSNRHSH